MKSKLPCKLSIVALLSTFAASPIAIADTTMGTMWNAIPNCAREVRAAIGVSHGPKFADRVVLTGSRSSVRTVKLSGTYVEDGARIPFEARCERGTKGVTVAQVTEGPDPRAIADVAK